MSTTQRGVYWLFAQHNIGQILRVWQISQTRCAFSQMRRLIRRYNVALRSADIESVGDYYQNNRSRLPFRVLILYIK